LHTVARIRHKSHYSWAQSRHGRVHRSSALCSGLTAIPVSRHELA
jgi:hypothetical protein